jgi:PAS domain S-box-containing protein
VIEQLLRSKIAIVGGGRFCKTFLETLFSEHFLEERPEIMGVTDVNLEAEGVVYARQLGIFTTDDYRNLYQIDGLQVIIELTRDINLASQIKKTKPAHIKVIEHVEARGLWTLIQIEAEKRRTLKELRQQPVAAEAIEPLFGQFGDNLAAVIKQRSDRYMEIEKELIEKERTVAQLIEGSTIPTFVINKDHIVTHWNKAMERLTDVPAEQIVGTNHPAMPFWGKERPTMADVILDQIHEDEIQQLYGEKWRPSALIEGAYEAEAFFPRMGERGKWCWFTAAPIKSPDGTIVGAIETLWDKTEDKKAEQEREQHTRELSTLCSIYSALNASLNLSTRIDQAVVELKDFLEADGVCIYLLADDGKFHMRYCQGLSEPTCRKVEVADQSSVINLVALSNQYATCEDLPEACREEARLLEDEKLVSFAYIPISTKERRTLGVIRLGSKKPGHFSSDQKDVLELIGNRIGVAIENAMLQEQYIKSEEKYRILFNNDPHPIFILDSRTFEILDTNKRAQDIYGYSRSEFLDIPFLTLGDRNDEELGAGLRNLSEDQSILFTKKRHFRKNGKPFYVDVNISHARYGDSHVVIATTTDITERVEKETQLIQAGKMTTLGVMAAGMAHEINQPLNVIQVCADFFLKMLRRGQPISDADLKTMADDIVANVERATRVIKHVRDFARQSEVVKNRVDINEPITDVFKVLGHQLKVHQIELKLDLDPDLPLIMAEHNRLEQVFINLVSNAIDAMDQKSEHLGQQGPDKVLTIRSFRENGQVCVDVSDTGIGMTEEVKNKIFEPFFTTKKIGKGTGLGTSISYGIVKDYDGTIEIESQVGQGTTFRIRFPGTGEHARPTKQDTSD